MNPGALSAAERSSDEASRVSYWAVVAGQLQKNGGAMAAWRVIQALLLVAIAAPFLAMNVPILWSEGGGISTPIVDSLFDRFLYPGGVDVFFNLWLVVGPLWWLVGRGLADLRGLRRSGARSFLLGRSPVASAALVAGALLVAFGVPLAGSARGSAALIGWTALLLALPWAGRVSLAVAGALLCASGTPTLGCLLLALVLPDVTATAVLLLVLWGALRGASAVTDVLLAGLPGAVAIGLARLGRPGMRARVRWIAVAACAGGILVAFSMLQGAWRETRSLVDWRSRADALAASGRGWAVFPPSPFHPDNVGETGSVSIGRSLDVPHGENLLGCDANGRDVAARMLFGTRISMTIGLVAVSIFIAIGTILGSLAGYYVGKVDILVSRLIEVMICFPTLFLLLTIIAVFDSRSIFLIMGSIGLVGWPGVSRLVRAEFLRQRNLDYVTAARAQGIPERRIIFSHVLPNCMGPVLVSATLGVASAILAESGLAFLGLGDPTTASWGQMLTSGRDTHMWHLILVPGFAIFLVVTVFNLLGEGLRDALDPKLRR